MYIIGLIFKSYVFHSNKRGILIKYLTNLFKSLPFWFILNIPVLLPYGLLKRKIRGVKKKRCTNCACLDNDSWFLLDIESLLSALWIINEFDFKLSRFFLKKEYNVCTVSSIFYKKKLHNELGPKHNYMNTQYIRFFLIKKK